MNRRAFLTLPIATLVPVAAKPKRAWRVTDYGPRDWVDTGVNLNYWNADLAWDPIVEYVVERCADRCLTGRQRLVVVNGPTRCDGVSLQFAHGEPVVGSGPKAWRVLVNPSMFNGFLERQQFKLRQRS